MPDVPGAAVAPYQYEFVATEDTARAMTRALMTLRGTVRLWLASAVALMLSVALVYSDTDMPTSRLERLVAAAGHALLITVPVWILLLALLYGVNLKNTRRRVPEGAVWRSGFEEAGWVVSGPLSSHRYSYDLVRSVRERGDFVFVQLRGNPGVFGYPRALFPDDALARLEVHQQPRSHTKERARVVVLVVACLMVLGIVVARAPVQGDAPDYANAAAIAHALQADGIHCTYRPLAGVSALRAASAGECVGAHYIARLYVYTTEQQRLDQQATFDRYVCEQGKPAGGWITGHRWLIGVAGGANTSELPDLRGATGGNFESAQCDGSPNLDDVR
jgi:hypothetical protein